MKEEDLKIVAELNGNIYELVNKIQNTDTLKVKIKDYLLTKSKDLPELSIPTGSTINDFIDMQLKQLMNPWMLNFIRYNPAPMLEKVKCPVLALNGEKDMQVPSKVNIPAIEKALIKGGNKKSTCKVMPGLNHLFQECTTGLPKEYVEIEQTIAPIALETITNWIKLQVK